MQTPQPSAEHKLLHRCVGTWDATMNMMGQASKGTMVVELGPGGFTTISHFKGDMLGMTFEGRGIDGYDATKKKFVSIWTDNMIPAPMFTDGTWDEKTQTMSMFGEMSDMTGKMAKHRLATTYTGADAMDFRVYALGADGKETPSFDIHYARKSK